MSTENSSLARAARSWAVVLGVLALLIGWEGVCQAQFFATTRAVGGIAVDADGVLRRAAIDDLGKLARLRAEALDPIVADLQTFTPLRKISLRGLEQAIEGSLQAGEDLPDEVAYLAGLQRVEYVLVYPQQHDIVLAGPAEGWKVDAEGHVVGLTTGQPVMLFSDLLVALRTARQAAQGGISCSIDPTPEGLTRFTRFMAQFRTMGDPQTIKRGAERALGPQKITLTNVPPKSHFARVLVAADYRMKRLGMGLEDSDILPSYVEMARPSRGQNAMPRWWLEPRYDPLLRSPDGLAWQLCGGSVKALTEDSMLAAGGQMKRSGQTSPIAQKWADLMTQNYDRLAVVDPVFGQLRNCMELAIVGALIVKERLTDKATHSLPTLLEGSGPAVDEFPAPQQVDSQVSMLKKGRRWMITASGGVMLNSWSVADKVRQSDAPAEVHRKAAAPAGARWWWN